MPDGGVSGSAGGQAGAAAGVQQPKEKGCSGGQPPGNSKAQKQSKGMATRVDPDLVDLCNANVKSVFKLGHKDDLRSKAKTAAAAGGAAAADGAAAAAAAAKLAVDGAGAGAVEPEQTDEVELEEFRLSNLRNME